MQHIITFMIVVFRLGLLTYAEASHARPFFTTAVILEREVFAQLYFLFNFVKSNSLDIMHYNKPQQRSPTKSRREEMFTPIGLK